MKSLKCGVLLAVCFLIARITPAQTTAEQWTIVTTSESVPAAAPVMFDVNGNPINCTGQNPDSTTPNASCYNPLTITFNLDAPSINKTFAATSAAVLNDTETPPVNLLSMTNYPSPVSSITVSLTCHIASTCTGADPLDVYTITIINQDNSIFKFTATWAANDPMNTVFESEGVNGATKPNSDAGMALVYRHSVSVPTTSQTGTFQNTNTDTVTIQYAGNQSNFSLNTVTITGSGGNKCFRPGTSHQFVSTDATALTTTGWGVGGFVSGDVMAFAVGDGSGTVIGLAVTPDANPSSADNSVGVFQNPDGTGGTLYVTFFVLASTNANCPVGLTAYDAPFHPVLTRIPRPGIRWRNLPWPGEANSLRPLFQ